MAHFTNKMLKLSGIKPEDRARVSELLTFLAEGWPVSLGEFSDNGSKATAADIDAAILYEVIETLNRQDF